MQGELADQRDLQARLLDAIGSVYRSIGASEEADTVLGHALRDQGAYDQAEKH